MNDRRSFFRQLFGAAAALATVMLPRPARAIILSRPQTQARSRWIGGFRMGGGDTYDDYDLRGAVLTDELLRKAEAERITEELERWPQVQAAHIRAIQRLLRRLRRLDQSAADLQRRAYLLQGRAEFWSSVKKGLIEARIERAETLLRQLEVEGGKPPGLAGTFLP